MPTQERRWRDEKGRPRDARQRPARRSQEYSVGRPKRRASNLPTQDRQLVPQHDDLKFFELRTHTDEGSSSTRAIGDCGIEYGPEGSELAGIKQLRQQLEAVTRSARVGALEGIAGSARLKKYNVGIVGAATAHIDAIKGIPVAHAGRDMSLTSFQDAFVSHRVIAAADKSAARDVR